MTGRELLEFLETLTSDQLEWEVTVSTPHSGRAWANTGASADSYTVGGVAVTEIQVFAKSEK